MRYSSYWQRVAAQLIDGVIINILVEVGTFVVDINFMLNVYLKHLNFSDASFIIFKFWYTIGYWCVLLIYEVWFTGSAFKATPGKLLMKINVVDKLGNKISYSRSLTRFLSKIFSCFLAIGFIMPLFTRRNQALHDKIANTLVVQSQKNINQKLE